MRPVPNSFCITVNGAWNPDIFSPDWVSQNLADDPEAEIQLAFSVNEPTAPRKISFEGIDIFSGRQQLTLISIDSDLEGLAKCSSVLVKMLGLLSHTPISSAGINFSFSESEQLNQISLALIPEDNSLILETYSVEETLITRRLKKNAEGYILNFALKQNHNGDYALSYNFHYDTNINQLIDVISSNVIARHYQESIDFAKNIYSIEIDDEDSEEEE